MNRLVIIGNGFDLAHGLKTSYQDFINWYWQQRLEGLHKEPSDTSSDPLCTFATRRHYSGFYGEYYAYPWDHLNRPFNIGFDDDKTDYCTIQKEPLFQSIVNNIARKGWADIEQDYYSLLKRLLKDQPIDSEKCKSLNVELEYLRDKLAEYLETLERATMNPEILDLLNEPIYLSEIESKPPSLENEKIVETPNRRANTVYRFIHPKNTMLLSFNYTPTAQLYKNSTRVDCRYNYIHGDLADNKRMIFGYGDELDKDFKVLLDENENEVTKYAKSIRYLEASHYRELMDFIEAGLFQVYIWGHSCGNSDRTLLNTIFEHENCISIKPYYYINNNGEDNYLDIIQNIYRNFTNPKNYRDKVVRKPLCKPLLSE